MRMFLATQIFLEQNPDAKKDTRWYVHSWMKQARDIPHGAKTVGLDGICRGPADYHMFQGVPDTSLCDMYRAGDVFMHLSEGGGFEIPILEAMRCGLPVMVTDFVGMPELARDHGWLIPWIRAESGAKGLYFSPLDATQAIADEYKAAEALADAYNNPDKARKFGLEGSKFAEKFDWSLVNPMWYKFFEEIRAEIRHAPLEERVIQ